MNSFVPRAVVRGLQGRGWFARLLLGLTALALLVPALAAMEPPLAGWSASHGHVYEDGVPVQHTHPWDHAAGSRTADGGTESPTSGGVTFTWDADSAVFALVVPMAVTIGVTATLLLALERLRPQAPRLVFARIPTPPPR